MRFRIITYNVHKFVEGITRRSSLISPDVLSSKEYSSHRIVADDFSMRGTRVLATQLLSANMPSIPVKPRKTYPGITLLVHVDRPHLHDPDFELREMHLWRTALSLLACDHLPSWPHSLSKSQLVLATEKQSAQEGPKINDSIPKQKGVLHWIYFDNEYDEAGD